MKKLSQTLLTIGLIYASILAHASKSFQGNVPEECARAISIYNECAAVASENHLSNLTAKAVQARSNFIQTTKQKHGNEQINYCKENIGQALELLRTIDHEIPLNQ